MPDMRAVCVTCSASLACVAGVARYVFKCHVCGKTVVQAYRRTIEIGKKPAGCKLGGLKEQRQGQERWPAECSPCFLSRWKAGLR